MHSRAPAIVLAARACIGTRFRPQGRIPGVGLDCIGVALVAAAAAGTPFDVPGYTLDGDDQRRLDSVIAGRCRTVTVASAGDIIVAAPAAGRRHLVVVTGRGVVHAHAGLRRVVEGPLDPGWQVIARWRFPEPQE